LNAPANSISRLELARDEGVPLWLASLEFLKPAHNREDQLAMGGIEPWVVQYFDVGTGRLDGVEQA